MVDAFEDDDLSEDIDTNEELSDDDAARPKISVFAPDLVIMHDKYAYKYSVTANRMLRPKALVRILNKGGKYIFNLGTVNLFEMLILNMFLVVYSYKMEAELIKEMQEAGKSDPSLQ